MYTLLVWEEVPEETKMYLIPNEVAIKYEGFLRSAHGHLINTVDDDQYPGLKFLNTALSDNEWSDTGFEQYRGLLKDYKVDMTNPILDKTITAVFHSGFIL